MPVIAIISLKIEIKVNFKNLSV